MQIIPMRRFSGRNENPELFTFTSFSEISPVVIGSNPAMQRKTVVFPHPLGPKRQPIAPFLRVSDKLLTTT
jgi:hypothetical protein